MSRVYLLYDARACGDCGQNGPPDESLVLVACESDHEARSYAGDFGDMACYSYRERPGSRGKTEAVDERWEWDWYVGGGFNDGKTPREGL
jgi:hypothetical protein